MFLIMYACIKCVGIGGQEDMRLIYGTIVARERARLGKEDKVYNVFNLYDNLIFFRPFIFELI